VGGTSASTCSAYPGCLLTPSGWVAGIHVVGAGLLLLLALVSLVLALAVRARAPRLPFWAAAALLVLLGMATLGSLFAADVLPTALAPVQYGFLAAFVTLDLILAGASRRAGRSGPPPAPRAANPAAPGSASHGAGESTRGARSHPSDSHR